MRVWLVTYLAVVLTAAGYLSLHPEYNWDLIPYTAAVVARDVHDPAAVHAKTYRLVRAVVPADRMEELVAPGYRRDVAESPRALAEQLPFYRIKPLYLVGLRALALGGMNPARATVWLSVLAYVGLGVLVWAWLGGLAPPLRFVAATLLAVSEPLLHVAGLDNPDALSALVVVAGLYLFVVRHRPRAALVLVAVAIGVRSDNVFLCALFAGLLGWRDRRAPRRWLVPAAVGVAGVAWVAWWHHHVGNYGWRLTMYHSFIRALSYPAAGAPAMSTTQLAKLWIGGLASLRQSSLGLAVLLFVCALARGPRRPERRDGRDAAWVLLGATALHALVFPNLEDRFFVAPFVVLALIGASWLLEDAKARAAYATRDDAVSAGGAVGTRQLSLTLSQ